MTREVLNSIILIDRSGSMQNKWQQTIDAVNQYINTTKLKEQYDTRFTVLAFDRATSFWPNTYTGFGAAIDVDPRVQPIIKTLRRYISGERVLAIGFSEVSPRGQTPLNDAIDEAIRCAEKDGHDKTTIIVITDGAENASTRFPTADHIRPRIQLAEQRGWEILFIGSEFESQEMATHYHMAPSKFLDLRSSSDTTAALAATSAMTDAYMRGSAMNYSADLKSQMWKGAEAS